MLSRPVEKPVEHPEHVLPGAQFADSYALTVSGQALDAAGAAQRAFGRVPRWISALMVLRNAIVRPFRLVTAPKRSKRSIIGFFPVISQAPERIVLGLDDRHLDFRLVIDVAQLGEDRQVVTASTVVQTHNLFGRAYLAVVKPFHRIIVPAMLRQVAST